MKMSLRKQKRCFKKFVLGIDIDSHKDSVNHCSEDGKGKKYYNLDSDCTTMDRFGTMGSGKREGSTESEDRRQINTHKNSKSTSDGAEV